MSIDKNKKDVLKMAEEKTTVERTQTKVVTDDEKKQKVRNFAVVVYPDSTTLNENWRDNCFMP